jgi:hypothetical protein
MRTSKNLAMALLVALLATGCGLCERAVEKPEASKSAAELASLIPADSTLTIFVGNWRDLRDAVSVLQLRLGKDLPVEAGIAEFKRKYGVDLQNPDQLKERGVEISRGLAVAHVDKSRVFLIPVDTPKLFETYLGTLAKERWDAAPQPVVKEVGGKKLKLYVRAQADTQQGVQTADIVMAVGIRDRTAILIPGKALGEDRGDPEVALGKLMALQEAGSLKTAPGFDDLRSRVGAEHPIFIHYDLATDIDERAEELEGFAHSRARAADMRKRAKDAGPVGFGVKIDDNGLSVHADILARGELKAQLASSSKAKAVLGDLHKAVVGEPVILTRLSGDPVAAPDQLLGLVGDDAKDGYDEALEQMGRTFGVKVREDVLPNLEGNLVLAIYEANIALVINPTLDGLMRTSRSVVIAGVADRAALLKALDAAVQQSGGLLTRTEDQDVVVYTVAESGGGLVIGPRAAVFGSRKMAIADLKKAARLGGPGVVSADAAAGRLWTGQTVSGLRVEVPGLVEMLGPMAQQGGGKVLNQFASLTLVFQATELGAALELEIPFVPRKDQGQGQGQGGQ